MAVMRISNRYHIEGALSIADRPEFILFENGIEHSRHYTYEQAYERMCKLLALSSTITTVSTDDNSLEDIIAEFMAIEKREGKLIPMK